MIILKWISTLIGVFIFSIGGLFMALGMKLILIEEIQNATLDFLERLGK